MVVKLAPDGSEVVRLTSASDAPYHELLPRNDPLRFGERDVINGGDVI